MDARILLFLAVTVATRFIFVIGKPISIERREKKIPFDPEVEPAKESELMVSTICF